MQRGCDGDPDSVPHHRKISPPAQSPEPPDQNITGKAVTRLYARSRVKTGYYEGSAWQDRMGSYDLLTKEESIGRMTYAQAKQWAWCGTPARKGANGGELFRYAFKEIFFTDDQGHVYRITPPLPQTPPGFR